MAEHESMSLTDRIMALAETLGKVEESDGLRILCEAAQTELGGLLKEEITPEDCGEAFVLAAAWLALAGLEVSDDGVESFTAGEVSIRKKDGSLRQKALRLQALQVIKPYARDEGFVFRGVRG